jgi:hypothetical protein
MNWQPIKTAPSEVEVLVFGKSIMNEDVMTVAKLHGEWGWWDVAGVYGFDVDIDFKPTHWMPLPEPPKAAGQT